MSVRGDSFNSSGSCTISDSSGSFNSNSGGSFASTDVSTTGSTRYFSGVLVGCEDRVSTKKSLDAQVVCGKHQTGMVSG